MQNVCLPFSGNLRKHVEKCFARPEVEEQDEHDVTSVAKPLLRNRQTLVEKKLTKTAVTSVIKSIFQKSVPVFIVMYICHFGFLAGSRQRRTRLSRTSKRRVTSSASSRMLVGSRRFGCSKCELSFVKEESLRCHLKNHQDTETSMAMTVLDLQRPFTLDSQSRGSTDQSAASDSNYANVTSSQMHDAGASDSFSALASNTSASFDDDIPSALTSRESVTAEDDDETAALSQAACNLLAFMENQHNMAVDDNLINTSRQHELDAAAMTSRSAAVTVTSSSSQSNVVVCPVSSVGTWADVAPTGLLSLAEHALDQCERDMFTSGLSSTSVTSGVTTHTAHAQPPAMMSSQLAFDTLVFAAESNADDFL